MNESLHLRRNAIGLIIISMISQLLGFLREVITAYYFGVSYAIDAYQVAEVIPLIITQIFVVAFPLALVPMVTSNKYRRAEDYDKSDIVSTSFIGISFITLIITILMIFFSKTFVNIIAPGLGDEAKQIAEKLTRILAPNTFLLTIFALFNAVLSSHKKFIFPAACGLLLNIFIISGMIMFGKVYGIDAIAVGSILASVIMFIAILFYSSLSCGIRIRVANFRFSLLKRVITGIFPVIIGTGILSINLIVTRNIASLIGIGAIATLSYAYRLINMPINIFVASVSKPVFTDLSICASEGRTTELFEKFRKSLRLILAVTIPISMFLIALRLPITSFLFERGQFNNEAVHATSICVALYSIGIFAIAAGTVMPMLFYSYNMPSIPLKVNIMLFTLNILLSYSLSKIFGYPGIAIGSSLAVIATLPLWYYEIRRGFTRSFFIDDFTFTVKNVIISMIAGVCIGIVSNINYIRNLHSFFIIIIGGVIGLSVIYCVGHRFYEHEFGFTCRDIFFRVLQRRR